MFNRLGPLKAVEQGHISMAHDASAKLNVPAFVNAKSLQGAVPQHAQGMEQQSKLASVTSEGSMFSRLYSRLSAAEPTPQTISEPAATSKSAAASAFHSRSPTPDPTEGDAMWYDFNADSDADMLEENEGVQPCAKMKSVSNNPGGRCTKANHQASLDRASILEDLKYEHPHGARGLLCCLPLVCPGGESGWVSIISGKSTFQQTFCDERQKHYFVNMVRYTRRIYTRFARVPFRPSRFAR